MDEIKFDIGLMIVMSYERNSSGPHCLVNEVLDSNLEMLFPPDILLDQFVRDTHFTQVVNLVIINGFPIFTLNTSP